MSMCPDPIHPAYGYALDSKGKPQWLDVVVQERQASSGGHASSERQAASDMDVDSDSACNGSPKPPKRQRKPLSPVQSPSLSP